MPLLPKNMIIFYFLLVNSRVPMLQVKCFNSEIVKANIVYSFKIRNFTKAWYNFTVSPVIV